MTQSFATRRHHIESGERIGSEREVHRPKSATPPGEDARTEPFPGFPTAPISRITHESGITSPIAEDGVCGFQVSCRVRWIKAYFPGARASLPATRPGFARAGCSQEILFTRTRCQAPQKHFAEPCRLPRAKAGTRLRITAEIARNRSVSRNPTPGLAVGRTRATRWRGYAARRNTDGSSGPKISKHRKLEERK